MWFGDASGQLLMARLIAAADRGVKVRLLFDDLSTMLRRMSSPEPRDEMLARIDRHPNIEIRLFNAWRERGWVGRVAEGAEDFERLNRRMHNKQMIAGRRFAMVRCGPIAVPARASADVDGPPGRAGIFGNAVVERRPEAPPGARRWGSSWSASAGGAVGRPGAGVATSRGPQRPAP